MNLSKHFTLEEMIVSQAGERLGLANIPSASIINLGLVPLCEMLDEIREHLGEPIIVTSGYRSANVNAIVGGAKNSAHTEGRAADIICPRFGAPFDLAHEILALDVAFDQLIIEFDSWVHIAIPKKGEPARRQVLTIGKKVAP